MAVEPLSEIVFVVRDPNFFPFQEIFDETLKPPRECKRRKEIGSRFDGSIRADFPRELSCLISSLGR